MLVASSLVGTGIAVWPRAAAAVGATAVTLAGVAALASRLRPSPLSPVHVTVGLYLGAAAATILVYPIVADAPFGTAFRATLSTDLLAATALLYVLAAGSLVAGATCCLAVTPDGGFARRAVRLELIRSSLERIRSSESTQTALLMVSLLPLALIVAAVGGDLDVLLNRSYYLASLNATKQLFGLGANLAVAVTLLTGFVWSSSRVSTKRALSLAVAFVYVAVFFSFGSRRLALVPVVFALGAYAAKPVSKRLRAFLIVGVGVGIALLPLPLGLRSGGAHGLVPYFDILRGGFSGVDIGFDSVLLNLLQGVPAVAVTAFKQPAVPLWVSLNPLPGNLAGWYTVSGAHRLNVNAPYPALGELRNHSLLAMTLYFAVAGFALARADIAVRRLMAHGHELYALLLVSVSGLFTVFSLQYNLRTSTRFLYFLVGLTLLSAAIPRLRAAGWQRPDFGERTRGHPPRLEEPRGSE